MPADVVDGVELQVAEGTHFPQEWSGKAKRPAGQGKGEQAVALCCLPVECEQQGRGYGQVEEEAPGDVLVETHAAVEERRNHR